MSVNNRAAPPIPKGKMPIEEVFKMMWARLNYLEEVVKEKEVIHSTSVSDATSTTATSTTGTPTTTSENVVLENTTGDQHVTTIEDLKQNIQSNVAVPNEEIERLREIVDRQNQQIIELQSFVQKVQSDCVTSISDINNSIETIGSDMTEMNVKYTQMNNFLMEIQTTQITVNNQILKHYNDNYSDLVESQIEKSADEKFNNKDTVDVEEVANEESTTVDAQTDGVDSQQQANASENTEEVATENTNQASNVVKAKVEQAEPSTEENITFNVQ